MLESLFNQVAGPEEYLKFFKNTYHEGHPRTAASQQKQEDLHVFHDFTFCIFFKILPSCQK